MSQITIGGTTLNFKDSAFTGDQWEQVASWVLNGGAEGIDANAQIATEKAAAAAASAAAARNSAKSAGESASAAASSAAKAANYNSGAQSSANRAAASATNAASSERNAASSAATADSASYSAESAATEAASSQSAAKQSERNAKTYESNASSSANNARVSETKARTYASSAAESIKHAPRINSSGKWELWDATKNAYVTTEYTAIGKDGAAGTDGTTPHIGENGNWYVGNMDTGVKAASVYYVDISGTNDDITGSKTFAEIKAAYEANNVVVARQNIAIYELTYISDTRVEFTRVDATSYTVWACSNSGAPSEADVWQFSNTKRVNYDTKYRDIGLKTVPVAIKELQDRSAPAVTDTDAGKYLHVNPSTKELEWAEIGNTSNYVLTEADKSEIAAMVMAKMSDGNTGS